MFIIHKHIHTLISPPLLSFLFFPSSLLLSSSMKVLPVANMWLSKWCLTLITCWHPCHGFVFKHYLMTNTLWHRAIVAPLHVCDSARRHRPWQLQSADLWRIGNPIWHAAQGWSARRCIHWLLIGSRNTVLPVLPRECVRSLLGNQLNVWDECSCLLVWFSLQGPKRVYSCHPCHLFMQKVQFNKVAVASSFYHISTETSGFYSS